MDQILEIFKQLARKAPWVIGVITIVAGIVSILVLIKYDVAYIDGSWSFIPKLKTADWRGFYVDVDKKEGGNFVYYRTHEDINLDFKDPYLVRGFSEGDVNQNGKTIHKVWHLNGYSVGEAVFLSYLTIKEEEKQSSSPGVGGYLLTRRGDIYVGYLIFRDSNTNSTQECPYVLTRDTKMSLIDAENKWPQLKENCKEVIFNG